MIRRESPGRVAVQFCSSMSLDVIAASHLIIDPSHHAFAQEWAEAVKSGLGNESRDALGVLSRLPQQCLEFAGLSCLEQDLDDVVGLVSLAASMSRTEFVYWALGGRVPLALVVDHFEGRRSAAAILPGAGRYLAGMGWAHDLLRDPEAYRGAACALWGGIAGSVVEQCGELNAFYEESTRILVGKFESSGASVHEFALESGGDDLRSGGGAHVYCFILSWFLSPHRVRWCDLQRQFIVPDWREVCVGSEKDRAQSLGKVVGALADTNRLVIMRELCRSRCSGRALAPRLGLTPATTAHHLDVLMSAGLVSREAVGSAQVYSADLSAVDTAVREMRSYLSYGPRQK